jgi:hypothetical protein
MSKSKRDDQKFIDKQKRRSQQGEERGGQKKTPLDLKILLGDSEDELVWYKDKKTKGKERNRIDILPWTISMDWYAKLKEYKGIPCESEEGDLEYALIIPVHYDVGITGDTVLCLSEAFGGHCAVCDEMFEKIKEDKVKHKDQIGKLRAKWRCFYNVFDHEDEEFEGIKLWEKSFHLFEKYLRQESRDSEDGFVPFADLELGKIIIFKGREKSIGDVNYIEAEAIEFEDRDDPYDNDVLNSVYALDTALIIPDAAEVRRSFLQTDDEGEDDKEEEEGDTEKEEEEEETPILNSDYTSRENAHKRKRKPKDKEEDNKCPSGFRFGTDTNSKDKCEECDEAIFEECCELQDKENEVDSGKGVVKEEKEEEVKPAKTVKKKAKKSFKRKK